MTMHRGQRDMIARAGRSGVRGVFVAVIFVLVGCNILGPATYLIGGMPKIDAEYLFEEEPELQRPTVVFVDDRGSVIPSSARRLRLEIADTVTSILLEKEIFLPDNMIRPRDALGVALANDRYSEPLGVDEIALAVGAEQIIYIEVLGFSASPDGVVPKPASRARVRVLDVVNQVQLYPTDDGSAQNYRLVTASDQGYDTSVLQTSSGRLKIYERLAELTGGEVAKLFYRHESVDLGDRLNPQ